MGLDPRDRTVLKLLEFLQNNVSKDTVHKDETLCARCVEHLAELICESISEVARAEDVVGEVFVSHLALILKMRKASATLSEERVTMDSAYVVLAEKLQRSGLYNSCSTGLSFHTKRC